MGYCGSTELYWNVQRPANARPMTHTAFAASIAALGGSLQDVVINGFMETENCFRALLRIRQANELLEVDVRPSNALNFAVVCNVPIFVSEIAWQTYMHKQE